MNAVTPNLHSLIIELQSFESLQSFVLAGGTNLALRYNHRESIDIDLVTNKNVGKTGLEKIAKEVSEFFGTSLQFLQIINQDFSEQYMFMRLFIQKNDSTIKVEILQNIQYVDEIEFFKGVKLLSVKDIGLLKLMSASNRKAKKDIYDLEYITNQISLSDLMEELEKKEQRFMESNFQCLFDLDDEKSPVNNLGLLLEFDKIDYSTIPSKPSHTHDRIVIGSTGKNWLTARTNWRAKVRKLYQQKGLDFPSITSVN